MEQFVIPQFIDEEPHILGPITVRQFIILLVSSFFIFLSYRLADFTLFIISTILFAVVGLSLAFIRINGRPFHYFLLNLLQTIKRPKLRIWKKQYSQNEIQEEILANETRKGAVVPSVVHRAVVSSSHLSELALIVDTGGIYKGENEFPNKSNLNK